MWRFILVAGLLCSLSGCWQQTLYNKLKQKIGENGPPVSPVVQQVEPS
jgi:hypothetical protein